MLTATIVGNVGGDPEQRFSANGTPMLRFNVAHNDRQRDKDGETIEHTEWVRVTIIGPRSEALAPHIHKGDKIGVSGKLSARPWTDQSGTVRAGLELVASEIELCGSRNSDQGARPAQQRQPQQPAANGQRQPAPQRGAYAGLPDSALPF